MVKMEMVDMIIFQKKKAKSKTKPDSFLNRGNTKKIASLGKNEQQIVETANSDLGPRRVLCFLRLPPRRQPPSNLYNLHI